jgi:hypothetical protein
VKRTAKLKWFAVKTAYRTSVQGKPKGNLPDYDAAVTLVEERVILVRAHDHERAMAIADKDADRYTKKPYTNVYGQRVTWRRLKGCILSYELPEDRRPAHLNEVWSLTQVIARGVKDAYISDNLFGPPENDRLTRMKFIDAKVFNLKGGDVWLKARRSKS